MATALDQIADLLREVKAPGSFSARRTGVADDLHLEVKGLGPLRFPISQAQAKRLCTLAQPASYGKGEQTLLNRKVRDTWSIPKSRVKIDQRSWTRTLRPVLEGLRVDLGLPEGSTLRAELHSLLVYGPGQFFKPHQDSEKSDDMIGTLVVTLPSAFEGGAFVIEHQGVQVTYRATKHPLTFIAFYADCRHEVREVKSGYRIVLTYNLLVECAEASRAVLEPSAAATPAALNLLADGLRRYFSTPLPRRAWEREGTLRPVPSRLVYLLDHQYTERGLSWQRLKGPDALRVAALLAAAERADCEAVLTLAEIQETWTCFEDEPRYGRRRRWEGYEYDGEDDEDDEDDFRNPSAADSAGYTLTDLADTRIDLHFSLESGGKKVESAVLNVDPEETCSTMPSSALTPYQTEFEGYMGNYGNTMDRWYRRGAIVLWPAERGFAVRAEASPAWALKTLKQRIQVGEVTEARRLAASLLTFWKKVGFLAEGRSLFTDALRVADGLEDPALAASLLQPFAVVSLTSSGASGFVAVLTRYGEEWVRTLLAEWAGSRRSWARTDDSMAQGFTAVPKLCQALSGRGAEGTLAAKILLEDRWRQLEASMGGARNFRTPSERERALSELAEPILSLLEGTAIAEADALRNEAMTFLCAPADDSLFPVLVQLARIGANLAPAMRISTDLVALTLHVVDRIEARLATSERDPNDWSLTLSKDCRCSLCGRLEAFLISRQEKRFEWPLAENGRKHIHSRIDGEELPVQHLTRRTGRPFTLVLTKTQELFVRESEERRAMFVDLGVLKKLVASDRRRASSVAKPRLSRR